METPKHLAVIMNGGKPLDAKILARITPSIAELNKEILRRRKSLPITKAPK